MSVKRRGTAALPVVLLLTTSRTGAQMSERVDYDAPNPQRTAVDYARAAANLTVTNWVIWQLAWARDRDWAPVTRSSLADNLSRGFEFDQDVLQTNFFGHPYHGSLLFNAARGTGLGFWEASAYAFAGSFAWELFAEREKPAINDLAVTAMGGILLGEITHRLASAALDDSAGDSRLLRELGAAAVSPLRGFDRLTSGRAFRHGPAGLRRPLRLELDFGIERVRQDGENGSSTAGRPAVLFAADIDYGNLLPPAGRATFEPFEHFELYAAANLFNSELRGAHVYSSALLWGESLTLSREPRALRDNDVLGLGMSYEYVGTNFTTYSGVGVGPVNHLVLRLGRERSLRLTVGAELVPVLGATSTQAGSGERDYNFASGFSPWSGFELRLGRLGELGLQMRHYVAQVIDGEPGQEMIGSLRLWYEVELVGGFGVGVAPTAVYRRGHYDLRESYWAQQLSAQFFVTLQAARSP